MRDSADSYSGKEKDFMKQTMLEHEAVFKDQVHELHRLYRRQRNLIDEVKGKNSNEDMNLSDHTSEHASKRQLPRFLSPNSTYGEASSSQPCNSRLQNGVSSKDVDGFEVQPARVGRRMIDLQLPPDEYLDTDETSDTCEKTIYPPYKHSKSGRGNASHQSNSSGSCLDVKNSNGLADLNEPLNWQESEPVALSRNILNPQYERNCADVHGQWMEKNKSQNGWMFVGTGHDRSTQRDQLHRPSHSVQVLSNNAIQSYPTTDHSMVNSSGERAYRELEGSSKKPQYGSYVESSVASNAPRFHNDYRPNFVKPWSHWFSLSESPMSSSSHQKSYPIQANPYMYFDAHARADSSLETRRRISNEIYQGPSSGSKQSFYNFPSTGFNANCSLAEGVKNQRFENLQGPKKQESSAGLPWLKSKPSYNSEISSGYFDLNASTDQFMDRSDDLTNVSSQKGLRYAPYSNNANMGRVEMINPQSSTKLIGCSSLEKIYKQKQPFLGSQPLFIADRHKEANHLVMRDLDINLPCDASVSVDQHGAKAFSVNKAEGKKPANLRHFIDLNSCASEDDEGSGSQSIPMVERKARTWIDLEAPPTLESEEEGNSSQEKTNEKTWGLMQGEDRNSIDELIKLAAQAIVAISSSDRQRHPDDAAFCSTDAGKDPLSWFAEITISCNELERKVNGSPEVRDCEGNREEYSSGEIDYLEAMTLNLQPTKEEDYMPEPLVPENLNFEVTGINRPRRGQVRRGRPKRDF